MGTRRPLLWKCRDLGLRNILLRQIIRTVGITRPLRKIHRSQTMVRRCIGRHENTHLQLQHHGENQRSGGSSGLHPVFGGASFSSVCVELFG